MSATEKNIYFPSSNEELQLEGEAGNVLGSKCKNNRRGGLASNGWSLHRSCSDVNKLGSRKLRICPKVTPGGK